VRKPPPPDLAADRLDDFVDAIVADKAGDHDRAYHAYVNAGHGTQVPAIEYNLADLLRRMERYEEAIASYKKYLALVPGAPDRAAVQRLIDQLAKTPTTLVVDGEDLDAVVFVDGKQVGPSPVTMSLPDGFHVVDRIGARSFRHEAIVAVPLRDHHVTSNSTHEGNVVLSTSMVSPGTWQDGGRTFVVNARFRVEPGHVDTYFRRPGLACSRLAFDVPARGLVYVFVDGPRQDPATGCLPITVRVQTLAFPTRPE
jgi:tetratricopeptide (TPR) repeat protein